ncbi:F-box domain-containing protein [Mycena sanguinolenta]|uniref:F-box domain-containing protein n=1 Tax=Mycena sanguinolenta TaxID=230812 RepID=A0A8H6ZEU1_9AGAR|nr:F-box domain-containing protein [Mycena sanguinolenta]
MSLAELEADLRYEDQAFIACIEALRPHEVTVTYPNPSYLPSPVAINKHFARTIEKWEPHSFTPQKRHAVQLEGLRYLAIAQRIETAQRHAHPRELPKEVEAQLGFVRQSYMLRCFRLFRINDLPAEIMTDILRFVIWNPDSWHHPIDARLRITWTCRWWREIALADSTLWNLIWFRPGHPIEREWTWFERASQTPLDIYIHSYSSGDHSNNRLEDSAVLDMSAAPSTRPAEMRKFLLRLFAKLKTIRTLVVVVEDWKSGLVVLELLSTFGPSSGVPMLQRLEIHWGLKDENRSSLLWADVIPHQFLGGAVAPSLEHLSLDSVPIDWSSSVIGNLTTLDLGRFPESHSPDAARFHEVLMNCPRLHKLSMDGGGPRFDGQSSKPVALPHLRILVVAEHSCQNAMLLFSQILAPNVNDLTLMNLCGEDFLPMFLQITAAFPKVRLMTTYSIEFDVGPVGLESMTRWLDSMPLLEYLRVGNVSNYFLGAFFRLGDLEIPVAPRLAFFDCRFVDPHILVEWVKGRHQFGTPLKKVYISEELANRLDSTQSNTLIELCTLVPLPQGATTPEERALNSN